MEYTLDLPETLTAKLAALGYDDPLDGLLAATKLLVGIGPEAWATITAAAADQNTTPAKLLLSKYNAPVEQPTRKAKTSKVNNAERDAQIWELARTGSTHAKIAATYGLSVIRVSQIVALQRARALAEKA